MTIENPTSPITWKPIIVDGITTVYEINEFGAVRNTTTGKLLIPSPIRGYPRVLIYLGNGTRKHMKLHRLVYTAFKGPIPTDMTVDHIDENRYNNHISNLRLLTASENVKAFLQNHPDHAKKISDEIICEYFKLLKRGMYYQTAAKRFDINRHTAEELLRGRKRRNLWEQYQPFPISAYRKCALNKKDEKAIVSLLMNGLHTKDIVQQLNLEYNASITSRIHKLRKQYGIKDPKFFDNNFLLDVDKLILDGKTNEEIYDIMGIEFCDRISYMMARRRKLLGIPNNNFKYGNAEEVSLIRKYIREGLSNDEILNKIGKTRNQYYINLFGKERKRYKALNNISTTIDQQ